jgi:hypothetical protein
VQARPDVFESLNELVWSALVLVAGGVLCIAVARRLAVHPLLAGTLFVWHTVLGTSYSAYVLVHGGDPLEYYMRARFDFVEPSLGTDFIVWITSLPVSLGLPFWPTSYLYNIAGALGLILFAAALQQTGARLRGSGLGSLLLALFIFMPSLSFWTSGIGKDALAFLSVALFLWSTADLGKRRLACAAAIVIMLPVRPHIAGLMLIGILAGVLVTPNLRAITRLAITAAAAVATFFAVPLAMVYAGTTRFSTLAEYVSDRQGKNTMGGSSVDITGMNPVMRLFTFTYRPLPREASGADQLAASIENVLLIGVTLLGLFILYRAGPMRVFRRLSIPATYGVLCLGLLSQLTANLGLATRQKWMALPALLFVVLGAWQMHVEQRSKERRIALPRFAGAGN